jgi:hypothetical protein
MEQQAVVRFFTLKGLKTRAIHTEFKSVIGPEGLALATVKKWRTHLHQGRVELLDAPRPGGPLLNDLAAAIGSMLKESPFSSCRVLCRHFRIGKATCLLIIRDKLDLKKSIFAGCRMHYRSTRRAKERDVRSSFSRH